MTGVHLTTWCLPLWPVLVSFVRFRFLTMNITNYYILIEDIEKLAFFK